MTTSFSAPLPLSTLRFDPCNVCDKLKSLDIFDANVSIGRRTVSYDGDLETPDEILRAMDRFGISRAVAYHRLAVENHPAVGNRLLMDELQGQDRLLPQWGVLPSSTGECPSADELSQMLRANGISSVRMAPASHGYAFAAWCCGDLLEMLAEQEVPVFISMPEVEWNDLQQTLAAFPGIRIILTDVGYRIGRRIYPLLRRFPELSMEYTGYVIHWGLEELCAELGPERFVFGSGLGRNSPGAPLTTLALADLPKDSRKPIAGENIRRILGREHDN